jgi:hypothetical protein
MKTAAAAAAAADDDDDDDDDDDSCKLGRTMQFGLERGKITFSLKF